MDPLKFRLLISCSNIQAKIKLPPKYSIIQNRIISLWFVIWALSGKQFPTSTTTCRVDQAPIEGCVSLNLTHFSIVYNLFRFQLMSIYFLENHTLRLKIRLGLGNCYLVFERTDKVSKKVFIWRSIWYFIRCYEILFSELRFKLSQNEIIIIRIWKFHSLVVAYR